MLLKRGTTLIEVMVAVSLTAGLFLGATTLFGFVSQRVTRDATETAVYTQANQLADQIGQFVSQSKMCDLQVSGSVTALRCQMPSSGVDTDQDGLADTFTMSSYNSSTGVETFNTGKYVWFYMSNSTGTWGTAGTTLWRASPATAANPVAGDKNTNWALYYGGNSRWNFIDSVTFSVDNTKKTTTFTINASSYNRAERSAASEAGSSDNTKVTITRTIFWRNYR